MFRNLFGTSTSNLDECIAPIFSNVMNIVRRPGPGMNWRRWPLAFSKVNGRGVIRIFGDLCGKAPQSRP